MLGRLTSGVAALFTSTPATSVADPVPPTPSLAPVTARTDEPVHTETEHKDTATATIGTGDDEYVDLAPGASTQTPSVVLAEQSTQTPSLELEERLAQLERDKADLAAKALGYELMTRALIAKQKELEAALIELSGKYVVHVKDLSQDLVTADAEIERLHALHAKDSAEANALAAQVSEKIDERYEFTERMTRTLDEQREIRAELEQRNRELEAAAAAEAERTARLSDVVATSERDNAELRRQLQAAEELEQRNRELQAAAAAEAEKNARLSDIAAANERENAELRKQLQAAEARNLQLEDEVRAAVDSDMSSRDTVYTLEAEAAEAAEKIAQLDLSLRMSETVRRQEAKQHADDRDQIRTLQEDLRRATSGPRHDEEAKATVDESAAAIVRRASAEELLRARLERSRNMAFHDLQRTAQNRHRLQSINPYRQAHAHVPDVDPIHQPAPSGTRRSL